MNSNKRQLARDFIPGGNSLLSKRSEMFSPDKWPGYFKSSKGITTTCTEGVVYKDFSHFSVGTNTLGYCDPDVNDAVISCIKNGNMSTLNPFEEVELAKKLCELHPWAEMARFAKTGGEANAIAVRIARASANSEVVAVCGYHGWHDWYLSANLTGNDTLSEHLLKGLSTRGVPSSLAGKTVTFPYGDIDALERVICEHGVGIIKMEVLRSYYPDGEYLKNVRDLADKYSAILIFDECTSGFRESFGGVHLNYNVTPDICVLGKTLGNGYPITAVIGKKNIMNDSQNTFISSTYFTDRIGYVAALATLDKMDQVKSWEKITNAGKYFRTKISEIFQSNNQTVNFSGMYALTALTATDDPLMFKTYLTEELLKQKILFSNLFYPSAVHTNGEIDQCISAIDKSLKKRNVLIRENKGVYFSGTLCHSTFERLN